MRVPNMFQPLIDRQSALMRNLSGSPQARPTGVSTSELNRMSYVAEQINNYHPTGETAVSEQSAASLGAAVTPTIGEAYARAEMASAVRDARVRNEAFTRASWPVSYTEVLRLPRYRGIYLREHERERLSRMSNRDEISRYLDTIRGRGLPDGFGEAPPRTERGRGATFTERIRASRGSQQGEEAVMISTLGRILGKTSDLNIFENEEKSAYIAEFITTDGIASDYIAENLSDLLNGVLSELKSMGYKIAPSGEAKVEAPDAIEFEEEDTEPVPPEEQVEVTHTNQPQAYAYIDEELEITWHQPDQSAT